ncbi:MAG: hypothetical protein KDK39_04265 [Leptospiraceae bacterium]|nr:hypothetical protein [Leptospiraceae bacterium]
MITAFSIIYYFIQTERNMLRSYQDHANFVQSLVQNAMQSKKAGTKNLAVDLVSKYKVRESILQNDPALVDLAGISRDLRRTSTYKNVWIQIIDRQGNVIARSWTDRRGDNVLDYRDELKALYQDPRVSSVISIGREDLTFNSVVPVFDGKEFIGVLETLTHFNSIDRSLRKKEGLFSVILVNESFKNIIQYPFTDKFVGDYYVANLDGDNALMELLPPILNQIFQASDSYYLYQDQWFFKSINITDDQGKTLGHYIIAQPQSRVPIADLDGIDQWIFQIMGFALFAVLLVGFILYNSRDESFHWDEQKDGSAEHPENA